MSKAAEDGVGIRAGKMLYPIFIGQMSGVILTALTFIVVARILGPSDYGVYTFAISFYALLNSFLAFGLGGYLGYAIPKKLYSKDHDGMLRAISSGYIISAGISGTFTLVGIALSGYVSGAFSHIGVTPDMLMIASATVVVYIISSMPSNILIGLSRSGLASTLGVTIQVMQLILSIFLTIHYGAIGAVAAIFIGCVIGLVPGVYLVYISISRYCKPRILLPSVKEIVETLRFAWPMGIANFMNNGMNNFAVIFLGLFVTPFVLGNYGAASKMFSLLALIYGTFGISLLPIFQAVKELKPKREVNGTYHKIMNFELIAMLPLMIFAGVLAVPFIYLFVGGGYTIAPLYFVLIAVGATIGLFGNYVNYLLISEEHTLSIAKVNFISLIVQLALVIVLVPYTKAIGMIVIIFFIGNVLEAILFAKETRNLFRLTFSKRKILLLYASSLVFGLVIGALYLVTDHFLGGPMVFRYMAEIALCLCASLAVYPVILIALRAVTESDLKDMRLATSKLGMISKIFSGFFDYSDWVWRAIAGRG